MKDYSELVIKLKNIEKRGFIKTHRKGDGGVGKTLEDLLGISENNVPGPDVGEVELKSGRKKSKSWLTLGSHAILPKGITSEIYKKYGYTTPKSKNKKILNTRINAVGFNRLKGKTGFKIDVKLKRINLVTKISGNGLKIFFKRKKILGYWDYRTLKQYFEKKFPHLVYVKAESKGSSLNEEFWYNEAWLFSKLTSIKKLLKKGILVIEIRIGQFPNGSFHDHGTAWRVQQDKIALCFKKREKIL